MVTLKLEAEQPNDEPERANSGTAQPPTACGDSLHFGRELLDLGNELIFAVVRTNNRRSKCYEKYGYS